MICASRHWISPYNSDSMSLFLSSAGVANAVTAETDMQLETRSLPLINLTRLALALGLVASPTLVHAEECGDTTCDVGTTCVQGETPCPSVLCVEDSPDCASDCSPEPYYYCEPAACDSDADCAEYMSCSTYESEVCPDQTPDCDGMSEAECEAAWDTWRESCEAVEKSECAITWHLGCQVAADCGEGFECTFAECSCPSASFAPPAGDVPPPDADCVCEPVDTGYCEPIVTECDSDDDCLEHWTCGDNYLLNCGRSSDGDSTCEEGPAKICQPPSLNSDGPFIELAALDEAASSSGALPEPDGSPAEGEVTDLPQNDDSAIPTSAANADVQELDSEKAADSASEAMSGADTNADGGGCSLVAAGANGNPSALLSVLGLALAGAGATRRRRR